MTNTSRSHTIPLLNRDRVRRMSLAYWHREYRKTGARGDRHAMARALRNIHAIEAHTGLPLSYA